MDSMTVQLSIVIVTVRLSLSFSIDDVAWMLLIKAGSETSATCVPCGGGGLLSWTLGEILPREWAMAWGQLVPQQESALAQAMGRVLVLAQEWMLGWEQVLGPGQVLVLVLGWEQALGLGLGLGLGLPLDWLVPHQLVVAVGCQPALRGCARECWRLHLGKDPSVGTWDKKGKGDRRSDGRENAGRARMLKEMATSTC